jgi:phosphotransacetylase
MHVVNQSTTVRGLVNMSAVTAVQAQLWRSEGLTMG